MKKAIRLLQEFAELYQSARLNVTAAALSYYLTMTVFPLLICLYSMLGSSYVTMLRIVRFAKTIFLPETVQLIEDFMAYVVSNNSRSMMVAGFFLLGSYASAAVRTLHITVYRMQGGARFKGLKQRLVSMVYSLGLLVSVYCAVLIMVTGPRFIALINRWVPFIDISGAWAWIRFMVLTGLFFCLLWCLYESPKRKTDRYATFPGAAFGAVTLLGVSLLYAGVISQSEKYSLVYGSLSSVILMMLWLYTSCLVMCCGAALNILLGDVSARKEGQTTEEGGAA